MIGFHSLLQRTASSCLLFAFLFTSIGSAVAAPPKPDFPTLMAYERALESSPDPSTKAIVKQILRGPIDLARERAAAQAQGIPLVSHLSPMPPLGKNAAPVYRQWMKNPIDLPNYARSLDIKYAYTPQQLARVQQILDAHPAEMHLLHLAADRPSFEEPKSKHSGIDSDGFELREAARQLNTESFLLAKKGHYADAIRNQARGFRVARHAASDGTLISYLVSVAIQDLTLFGMHNILSMAGPNADVDVRVQNAIQSNRSLPSVKVALSGEVIRSLSEMEGIRHLRPAEVFASLQDMMEPSTNHKPSSDKSSTPEERHFLNALFDAVEAEYLYEMRLLIIAADKPTLVRHRIFASVSRAVSAYSTMKTDPIRVLSAVFIGFPYIDQADDRIKTQEEVTLAGAALLAVRAHTARFPKSLPPGFTDSFNGKALGYRQEGKGGFVVYSVAPNGKFDGGKTGDPQHGKHVFFRYPAPPPIPLPGNS